MKRSAAAAERQGHARGEDMSSEGGIALITVMLLLMVMTIIGIMSLTVTGVGNRMAWFGRTGESAGSAAESCVQTAVKIIQQTIDNGSLPAAFLDNANPAGPVPQSNSATLNAEIMGQSDNNSDASGTAPNTLATVDNHTVRGDIDRLYAKLKSGAGAGGASGYEGTGSGSAGGGVEILYRIDCTATNVATNASSRVTAIYSCTTSGETCQK